VLLTAAAALAVVHVIGVLFARPLFRPAELLATLCLLACAIHSDMPTDRGGARSGVDATRFAVLDATHSAAPDATHSAAPDVMRAAAPADRGRAPWWLSAAAVVLVAGAALTVPAPGTGAGWQVLSPEEYGGLVRQAQLRSLAQVTAALLVVLLLLGAAALRRRKSRKGTSRAVLGTAIATALLIIGYVVARSIVILSESRQAGESSQFLTVAAVLPLLLALAALTLAVATIAHRQWRAAAGAVLFMAVAAIWIDAAIGAAAMPYEIRDHAEIFAPDLITSTDTLPQPTQALTAALHLTASILLIAGLTRPPAQQTTQT
jgi:cytochrome bd-type quinol oxidase subunit 2